MSNTAELHTFTTVYGSVENIATCSCGAPIEGDTEAAMYRAMVTHLDEERDAVRADRFEREDRVGAPMMVEDPTEGPAPLKLGPGRIIARHSTPSHDVAILQPAPGKAIQVIRVEADDTYTIITRVDRARGGLDAARRIADDLWLQGMGRDVATCVGPFIL